MDISNILDGARANLLRDGGHAPMLLMEFEDGQQEWLVLQYLPETTAAKTRLLFEVGAERGRDPGNAGRLIKHLVWMCEMWTASYATNEAAQKIPPSAMPNRREVLGCIILDCPLTEASAAKEMSDALQRFYIAEIVRDPATGSITAVQPAIELQMIRSKLLPSFLGGYMLAQLPEEMQRAVMQRAAPKMQHKHQPLGAKSPFVQQQRTVHD
jgi:hypothetical protein